MVAMGTMKCSWTVAVLILLAVDASYGMIDGLYCGKDNCYDCKYCSLSRFI